MFNFSPSLQFLSTFCLLFIRLWFIQHENIGKQGSDFVSITCDYIILLESSQLIPQSSINEKILTKSLPLSISPLILWCSDTFSPTEWARGPPQQSRAEWAELLWMLSSCTSPLPHTTQKGFIVESQLFMLLSCITLCFTGPKSITNACVSFRALSCWFFP